MTVVNHGTEPLRLVGRHWYIIDENGELAAELPDSLRLVTALFHRWQIILFLNLLFDMPCRSFATDPPELMSGMGLEYHSGVDLCDAAAGRMSGLLCVVSLLDKSYGFAAIKKETISRMHMKSE